MPSWFPGRGPRGESPPRNLLARGTWRYLSTAGTRYPGILGRRLDHHPPHVQVQIS